MLNGFANVPMLTPSSEITNVSSDTVHNKFVRFCLKIKKPQILVKSVNVFRHTK